MIFYRIGEVIRGFESRREDGATATEYSLLVGFIALAIFSGVGIFGNALNAAFQTLAAWAVATF